MDEQMINYYNDIQVNSIVYIIISPEIRGVVTAIKNLGGIVQYSVFVNNEIRQYYGGQIAPLPEAKGNNWIGVSDFRCLITAYQINNPCEAAKQANQCL